MIVGRVRYKTSVFIFLHTRLKEVQDIIVRKVRL